MNKKRLLIPAIPIALFIALGLDVRLQIHRVMLSSDTVHNRVRVLHLSDLHSCKYGAGQKTLLDAIDRIAPDLICLTGDIFDDDIPDDNTVALLQGLSGRFPMFYVTGNHEFWSRRVDEQCDIMQNFGVNVLAGTSIPLTVGDTKLTVCGVDDPDVDTYAPNRTDWRTQLDALESVSARDTFTIFLSHRPERARDVLPLGVDLILCGHAHGGMWRLPFAKRGLLAPNQGFFPKYDGGVYRLNDTETNGAMEYNGRQDAAPTNLIVSRGLARESTRVPRFYNRPELVVIDIDPLK